jgi:hypothetical protein
MLKLFVGFSVSFVSWLFLGKVAFMHTVLFPIMGFGITLLGLTCLGFGYYVASKVK